MTDQVFLFGSFTEDEANSYQASTLGSPSGKTKQSTTGAVRANGIHPAQPTSSVVKENGHVAPPKAPTPAISRISANGKADNVVSILGKTLGQTPKKNPAKPGSAVAVGVGLGTVKASGRGGTNNSVVAPAAMRKAPPSSIVNQAAAPARASLNAAQKIVSHSSAKTVVNHSAPPSIVNRPAPQTVVNVTPPETIVNHPAPETIVNLTPLETIVNHPAPQTIVNHQTEANNTADPTIVNHTAVQTIANHAVVPTIVNHTPAPPATENHVLPDSPAVVCHTTYPSTSASVPSENGDPADWLVVNVPDVSSAKTVSDSQQESLSELQNTEVAKADLKDPTPALVGTAKMVIEGELQTDLSAGEDPQAVPAKLLPKSWAALVGVSAESNTLVRKQAAAVKGRGRGPSSQSGSQRPQELGEAVVAQVTALSGETWLKSLREADLSGRRLQPRGLINTGNSCFLNSTMQAMLSCSAFTHLLQVLKARNVPETGYPTLQAFVQFSAEFGPLLVRTPTKTRRDGDSKATMMAEVGKPFAPAMFDTVLQSFTPDQPPRGTGRNRQEDAQEFLSFVIDRMHEELLRLQGKDSPSVQSISSVASSEDDDWEMVGPKNRSAVTRTHTFSESAITDIFGGQLRSVVKTKGNKASATVQPFLVLHLDIVPEVVHSVEDALRFFAAPESLEGYKPSTAKVGEVVSASKSVKIQTLPRVLILHLMRFSYGSAGSSKLHKPVQFPLELMLGRELLASTTTSGNEIRKYELVATVSHHGKDPSVGHYTADSKQASGQWLHFDDGVVSGIGVTRVLQEQAYVLFYKRAGF